jgi:hypothetical protein
MYGISRAALLVAAFGVIASTQAHALTIDATYDPSVPLAAQTAFNQVVSIYDSLYSNPVTVNINVTFGNTGLGQSLTEFVDVSYADWRSAMLADAAANAANAYLNAAVTTLPVANPLGNGLVQVRTADARALGLTNAQVVTGTVLTVSPASDSTLTFTNAPNSFEYDRTPTGTGTYDFQAVAVHELDEVLGVDSTLDSNSGPLPTDFAGEDYFRYGCNAGDGRAITNDINAAVCFKYDGVTKVKQFNQDKSGDFNDWALTSISGDQPAAQDAFGTPDSVPPIGAGTPEQIVLNTIGWDPVTSTSSVPEPASVVLVGSSLLGLGALRRRRG